MSAASRACRARWLRHRHTDKRAAADRRPTSQVKLAFHDANTDTDILADILARIVATMLACRSACHRNNFNRACRTCRRESSRGSRCVRRGMRALSAWQSWTGKSPDTAVTHDLLRTSSRGCHWDVTRKTVPWNLSFIALTIVEI